MSNLTYNDFLNTRDRLSRMQPAVPYASPADIFSARLREGFLVEDVSSRNLAGLEASRDFAERYTAETGTDFNQIAKQVQDDYVLSQPPAAGVYGARPEVPGVNSPEIAERVRLKYLEENPNAEWAQTPIPERAAQLSREAAQVAADLSARAGTLGEIAGLGGDLVAGVFSPVTLATVALTPISAAGVGARAILRVAGREAAVGAISEIPAQVVVQDYKEEIGLPSGFWQGAINVAITGGLSGALGGAIRGIVELRDALRVRGKPMSEAARRLYDELPPGEREALQDSWSDTFAVEAIVTRQYENNPRFRNKLTKVEREAIEESIQTRKAAQTLRVESQAELDRVEQEIANAVETLETGIPSAESPIDAEVSARAAPPVDDRTVEDVLPSSFLETATDEELAGIQEAISVQRETTARARQRAEAEPTDVSSLPVVRGREGELADVLRVHGRTADDVQKLLDEGSLDLSSAGRISSATIRQLRNEFERQARDRRIDFNTLAPMDRPPQYGVRTLSDIQTRDASLPREQAVAAQHAEMQYEAIKAKTDQQLGEEAEASVRTRVENAEGETRAETDPIETDEYFTLYHGTVYDFEEFDLTKMGTGEGNQAFGAGIYLADAYAVARAYGLEVPKLRGGQGLIYSVRVNAPRDSFLDLDLPISRQPEAIQRAWDEFGPEPIEVSEFGIVTNYPVERIPPEYLFEDPSLIDALRYMDDEGFSNVMEGIAKGQRYNGFRYKDAASRVAGGDDTSNYVVFNTDVLQIVERRDATTELELNEIDTLRNQENAIEVCKNNG